MSLLIETITRHSIRNYGSFLQTLATQQVLREAGASVRFIDYRQANVDDSGWSFAARGKAGKFGIPGTAAYALLRDANVRSMGRLFESAVEQHLTLTQQRYRSPEELEASREFDASSAFCVGSDQVWNVSHNVDNRPYYLNFAPRGAMKFSLSSSIGMAELPANEEAELQQALSSFAAVSVREGEARDYLSSLGINAQHHVDPTLAVSRQFWETFAGQTQQSAPYLLVYQLNGSATMPGIVSQVANALDLPIRRIEYWRHYRRRTGGEKIVLPTVQEFVGLFRGAACVITDSFHGVALSSIFDRNFVAVPPPKYAGRLESLLALTGRPELLTTSPGHAVDVVRGDTRSSTVASVLENERVRVREYVKSVLGNRPS